MPDSTCAMALSNFASMPKLFSGFFQQLA